MADPEFDSTDSGGDVSSEAAAAQSVIDMDSDSGPETPAPDFDGYVTGEGGEDTVPDRPARASRQEQRQDQAAQQQARAASEANERFRQRQERRTLQRQQADLELTAARERADKATRLSNTLLQMLQRQKAEAEAQQDDGADPELRAALDRQRQQLREELGEELRPLREETERQRLEREQAEQYAQQQQVSEVAWSEFRGEIVAAEQDYRATPQGQGYDQRVHQYKGKIAEIAQDLAQYVPELGNPQVVEALILEDMKGIAGMAHAFRVSPAVMMDIVARRFLGLAQGNGVSRRRQGAVSREVQVAREATMAGATHRGTRSAPQRGGRQRFVSAEEILERDISTDELEQMASSGRFADMVARLAQDAEEIAEDLT